MEEVLKIDPAVGGSFVQLRCQEGATVQLRVETTSRVLYESSEQRFVSSGHIEQPSPCIPVGSRGLSGAEELARRVGNLRHRVVLEEMLKNYRLKQNIATGHVAFEPPRNGQHDDLLFATCLGVWAWEHAIEKTEYHSFPGEWVDDVPTNDVGENS